MEHEHRRQPQHDPVATSSSLTARADERTPRHNDEGSRAIQSDIDRTRSNMDSTLDELGQRLKPSNLLDSVVGYFAGDATPTSAASRGPRDESVKHAAGNVGDAAWRKVKENPFLATGIGAAVAWMFLKDDSPSAKYNRSDEPRMYGGSYVDARTGQPYDVDAYEAEGRRHRSAEQQGSSDGGHERSMLDKAGDAITGAAASVGDAASNAASRLGDAFSSGTDAAGSAASRLGDQSAAAGRSARDRSAQGYAYSRDRFDGAFKSNPLAVGAAALAAGVLAGLVLPRTRKEDEWVGSYSRQAKDEASSLAGEAVERGQAVVERVVDEASAEAERQGLTSETLGEAAGDVIDRAEDAAGRLADAAADATRNLADEAKGEVEAVQAEADRSDAPTDPDSLEHSVTQVARTAQDAAKDEAQRQRDEMRDAHGV